ncbi:MAG: DNA polymerase III subunit beta [Oscillospiraceae bacterium]|nr:DNA polymerase III subunit beta [Oscillospiraceae bacterium]
MKFSCNKQFLCEAITNVSRAVASKSTIPALEGIKVKVTPNQLELTGYDLEIGIRTSLMAITEGEGEFVADARIFSEMTRKMSDDVIVFELNPNMTVTISSGNTQCSIATMSAEDYPDLPEVNTENPIKISQDKFKSMISQTSYAVASSEIKPIFTGELFDIENGKFNMVAMDGFRLAIRSENIEYIEKNYFVVPKKTLLELSGLMKDNDGKRECNIYINPKNVIFDINGYFVISRLIDGEFHNYKKSIPADFKTEVLLNTKDFITSMERCSLLLNSKNQSPVKCSFENGEVHIECKTSIGEIDDTFNAEIEGQPITIGFNNKFALDALRASESDKIKIQLSGSTKVIKILPPEGEDFIFLLMPIQLR